MLQKYKNKFKYKTNFYKIFRFFSPCIISLSGNILIYRLIKLISVS